MICELESGWVYELRLFVNKRMSWVCGLRYSGQAFLVPDPWAKFSTSYQYRITVTNTNIGGKKKYKKTHR